MPHVHVCPLSQVSATVAASRASHLVSLINDDTPVVRPASIAEENHLFLGINDITEPMDGMVLPARTMSASCSTSSQTWDRSQPMVVHCYAGISRSTAAAFITLCAVKPERAKRRSRRRMRAASRFAYPNPRIVAIGDRLLARNGRMVAAVNADRPRRDDLREHPVRARASRASSDLAAVTPARCSPPIRLTRSPASSVRRRVMTPTRKNPKSGFW